MLVINNLTLRIFCSACRDVIGCQYFKSEKVTHCRDCDISECELKKTKKFTRGKIVRGSLHKCGGPFKERRPFTW